MDQQRLHDRVLDRHAGIERPERVLKDDLHAAPRRPQRPGPRLGDLRPSNMTCPAVAGTSRISSRPSVDFPQPDSPTSPRVSPGSIVRSTPSTARKAVLAAAEKPACVHRIVLRQAQRLQQRAISRCPARGCRPPSWPGSNVSSGGIASLQAATAWEHRAENRHPAGRRDGSGRLPGMATSRS